MVSKEEIKELKENSRQNETDILEFIKGKKGGGATIEETANKFKELSPKRVGQILTRLFVRVEELRIVENGKGGYIYHFEEREADAGNKV